MCKLCDEGIPQHHSTSRRDFLKATAASGVAAAGAGADLFAPRPAEAHGADVPHDTGRRGRRYIIRGGAVMSMDPAVGDFPEADVLVEGKKILAVGPHLRAGGASVIDARGRVVMPGFIDTHHHQAWTAIRSAIPDSILINDGTGTASAEQNYFENVLAGIDRDDWLRPPLPAAGRLRQRAVRRAFTARRRRHDRARHLADPPLAAALRCGHRGASRYWPPRHAGLLRKRRQCRGEPVSARCEARGGDLVVRRSRRLHHGRRGLSRGADLQRGLEDRPRAEGPDRGAHPVTVRHPPDPRRARRGYRRRQQRHRARTRQCVHPHDRHVGQRLERGQEPGAHVSIRSRSR